MMVDMDNALATATAARDALVDLQWECGPVEMTATGAQFAVTQPWRTIGAGKRARVYPEQRQVRAYDERGTLTMTVVG